MDKRMNPVLLIIILLIMAALFVLLDASQSDATELQSENGVWDLQDFDFSHSNARLAGPVEYLPEALLTPEEFAAREDEAVLGFAGEDTLYATTRIRLLLPDDGYYTFSRISTDYADRIYVNGRWLHDIGVPSDSFESGEPNTARITFTAQSDNGIIEIVQQSSNFGMRGSGIHPQDWRVGAYEFYNTVLREDYTVNILLGCYLALFLIFILIYFLLRRYKANLYFALFCLMWFLRSGVTGSRVFAALVPWLSGIPSMRMEYIAMPIAAILILAIIRELFPGVLHTLFLRVLYILSAVFVALFLFVDTLFISYIMLICEGIYFLGILYVITRFIMKLRRLGLEQIVFVVGMMVFLYAAVRDFFYYSYGAAILPPFANTNLTQIAMLEFALCEAIAVFIATVRETGKVAVENAMLKENVSMNERQLDMQRTQYIRLMENVERAKRARHDMRHQLATIGQLSDEEPVKGYVESLLGELPDITDAIYCENVAVNAVVNHYVSLTADKSISVDVRLDIPENTGRVIAMDLCVLIGNLLENAVEACRRMSRGDRFIRVRSRIQAGGLSIVIENSFDGIWNEHDGVYISRKTNNSGTPRNGVGLSSVQAICNKYDGMFKAEVNNQAWKVSALLEMGG